MVSKAQKSASKRYDKANIKQRVVKFGPLDAEVLAFLDAKDNKSGYIKQLIREDMKRSK